MALDNKIQNSGFVSWHWKHSIGLDRLTPVTEFRVLCKEYEFEHGTGRIKGEYVGAYNYDIARWKYSLNDEINGIVKCPEKIREKAEYSVRGDVWYSLKEDDHILSDKKYGVVYIYHMSKNLYKIGMTTQPQSRLGMIKTHCPYGDYIATAFFENYKTIEESLHTYLKKYRIDSKREWFKIPKNVLMDVLVILSNIDCEKTIIDMLNSEKSKITE